MKPIENCRISGSKHLIPILNLGHQSLTGIFPKEKNEDVTKGPLELIWCPDSGLVQLKHSYDTAQMYGNNYGYRSGLNGSMVQHLQNKARWLEKNMYLDTKSVLLDIGSNDGTFLNAYSDKNALRVGIDPTAKKFLPFYHPNIKVLPDFFNVQSYNRVANNQKATIITSIAMFYDLENPIQFVQDIHSILDDNGIWHFEQSYMPSMLRMNSYDTVCHEHIEYYSLSTIKKILDVCGFQIIDVQINSINGGSLAVTVAKTTAKKTINKPVIHWLLEQESNMGLHSPRPFRLFEEKVFAHRKHLTDLVHSLNADGKKIFGYGASTKGNVILQFCEFTSKEIPFIAEINSEKFGCYTPGTKIPIISEKEAKAMQPDYFLVLPWHFKNHILEREKEFINNGGKFIFPLPEIEIF